MGMGIFEMFAITLLLGAASTLIVVGIISVFIRD
jgi:hypothetical protein